MEVVFLFRSSIMSKEQKRRFTGKFDANRAPLYEGDVVETKYGRHCKIIWFESPVFSGWGLIPHDHLECPPPDKHDLWEDYNLTLIDVDRCSCWRTMGKPSKAYCTGTKDLDYCSCNGDRTRCDFYATVRAKASGSFEDSVEAAIIKLQRLNVLDEDGNIAEEYRNILMKK
jgi:hypothetical protein